MTKPTQQEFLRTAAKKMKLTQYQLAERMGAPWTTFQKWLAPTESLNAREMPQIAWQLVLEIQAHEKLKKQMAKKAAEAAEAAEAEKKL